MNEYTESIRDKIINNEADDVSINAISLREYMLGNKEMRRFLGELASIEGSEISDISPKPYLEQLKWLGMAKHRNETLPRSVDRRGCTASGQDRRDEDW